MTGVRAVNAKSYELPHWQQLVQASDFIGVVECIKAGGIVAKYKVEESWLGMEAGTEFLLEEKVDAYGDSYPISLCGERMLVMAKKQADSEGVSPKFLFWRIPADYHSLAFGQWKVSPSNDIDLPYVDSVDSLQTFKLLVRGFLKLSEEEREREVILSMIRQYFPDRPPVRGENAESAHLEAGSMIAWSQKQPDVKSLVKEILQRVPKYEHSLHLNVLQGGGGKVTLELLNAENTEGWPESQVSYFNFTKKRISERLGHTSLTELSQPVRTKVDSLTSIEERLQKARLMVESFDPNRRKNHVLDRDYRQEGAEALELLILNDPDFISDLLLADHLSSYFINVVLLEFCQKCQKDREAQFTKLQKAEDPFVKVVAAMHLYFENKELGLVSLQSCSELPGDDGAWAALTLARRGDKIAFKRALKVFASGEPESTSGWGDGLRHILQQRLLVLLSNSANASQLPSPPFFNNYSLSRAGPEQQRLRLNALEKWWAEHSDDIKLHDPWLEILDRVKKD